MRTTLFLTCVASTLTASALAQTHDSDRDGISDFREVHKHRTDPLRPDTDGDGVDDGDWFERREFTYTVRAVIRVRPNYDLSRLEDDFQDARLLDLCDEYAEIEFVLYPFNTVASAIDAERGQQSDRRSLETYLEPGVTTNWNPAMREELLAELQEAKIEALQLDEPEFAARVARHALERGASLGKTCIWALDFDDGNPVVPGSLRHKFDMQKGSRDWSDDEQFEREVFGAGMFANRSYGTCTTTANYLTTVLRAAAIPTRMILTIPVLDCSDPRNVELLEHVTHPVLRRDLRTAAEKLGESFAAHTFNEVHVAGRWRRLNYARLGQNILDPDCMGLMVRVHTFEDLSTAGLCSGWGLHKDDPSRVFRGNNPYTTIALRDSNGPHSQIEIPSPEESEKRWLTITDAFWFDSPKRPPEIAADWNGASDPSCGHVLVRVVEPTRELESTWAKAGRTFDVQDARGHAVASAWSPRTWWADRDGEGGTFYLRIEAKDFARLKPGQRYSLVPVHASELHRWRIQDGEPVGLRR